MELSALYMKSLEKLGKEAWPAVLDAKDAEKAVGLLALYAEAWKLSDEAHETYFGITKKTHPIKKERCAAQDAAYAVYITNERKSQEAETALLVELYGEEELRAMRSRREEEDEEFEAQIQADLDATFA
jgi:hypothetical protein